MRSMPYLWTSRRRTACARTRRTGSPRSHRSSHSETSRAAPSWIRHRRASSASCRPNGPTSTTKSPSMSAQMRQKGRIKLGADADISVFDAARVQQLGAEGPDVGLDRQAPGQAVAQAEGQRQTRSDLPCVLRVTIVALRRKVAHGWRCRRLPERQGRRDDMETELLREKIARLEAGAPLARRRSRP